jgi:hypothetical protein
MFNHKKNKFQIWIAKTNKNNKKSRTYRTNRKKLVLNLNSKKNILRILKL